MSAEESRGDRSAVRRLVGGGFALAVAVAVAAAGVIVAMPAQASSADIVVNEVFSANASAGTTDAQKYDWVELKNLGSVSVDVTGWRIYDEDRSSTKNFTIGTSDKASGQTTIPSGGYLVLYLVTDPGLGKGDSVSLTTGSDSTGAFDATRQVGSTVTWPSGTHASPSWGRKADGSYAMTSAATPGAANTFADGDPAPSETAESIIKDAGTGLVLDFIDLETDEVRLVNRGTAAVDLTGWTVKDDDDTHVFPIPAGTVLAAGGGEQTFGLNPESGGGFGLGKADKVRVYSPAGILTLQYGWSIDDATWAADKTTITFKANSDADGMITQGVGSTASPSADPGTGAATVEAWPGLQAVRTVDSESEFGAKTTGGEHTDGNLSGLVYQPATSSSAAVLWAADNDLNPTLGETAAKGPGAINKFVQVDGVWQQDPSDGWSWLANGQRKGGKQLLYKDGTGGVDSEGITLIEGDSSKGVFIASERDNTNKNVSRPSILRYDVTQATTDGNGDGAQELTATNEWNLLAAINSTGVTLSTKDEANLGLEGVAFVPDSYLTANGFTDKSGAVYNPSAYGDHFGGLFLAALEKNGHIYAVALGEHGDTVSLVQDIAIPAADVAAGFTVIQDLTWDADTNRLLAQCDNSCGAAEPNGTAKLASYEIGASGTFGITHLFASPSAVASLNTEGFAIAPLSSAGEVAGGDPNTIYRQVFWSDDAVTNGYSLRTGYLAAGTAPASESPSPSASTPAVATPAATSTTVRLSSTPRPYGTAPTATVEVSSVDPSRAIAGTIRVLVDGRVVATKAAAGHRTVSLPATLAPGRHSVSASFVPSDAAALQASSSVARTLIVTKAATSTSITLPKRIVNGKKATATVRVTSRGTKPAGTVRIAVNGKTVKTVTLKAGKTVTATVRISATGKRTVSVKASFPGSARYLASSATKRISVR